MKSISRVTGWPVEQSKEYFNAGKEYGFESVCSDLDSKEVIKIPSWPHKENNKAVDLLKESHAKAFGDSKNLKIHRVHGGLESGIIVEKQPEVHGALNL